MIAESVCRSAVKVCVAACVAGMCFHVFADATPGKVYCMKGITLGTVERNADDCSMCTSASTVVPATATLAFPGLTVADLQNDQYTIYGFICGRSVDEVRGKHAGSSYFGTHTNAQGVIDKAFNTMAIVSSPYVKSVSVEYTDGSDGVYARVFSARYYTGTDFKREFVSMEADGTYKYYGTETAVATDWVNSSGYGIAGLTAVRFPRVDMWLPAWENESGEPVLTLDDVKDYDFNAFMSGSSVDLKGAYVKGYNKRLTTDGNGSVTGMTIEFQVLDDIYVKCVIVDFENGANGIVCKARAARYQSMSGGGYLGYVFMNANGDYNGIKGDVSPASERSRGFGYAVYELTATPPPPEVTFVLDESKTWTQLVAGGNLESRATRINVQVTGENPVLTFDAPLDRACVAFTGNPGECTLVRGNDAFTIDRLEVAESLTINMDHTLSPTTVALESAAKVVYAPEGAATVSSVFTGEGDVEISSGDVTLAAAGEHVGGMFKVNNGVIVSNRVNMTFNEIENNGTIVFTPIDTVNSIYTDAMKGAGTVVVAAADNRTARLSFYNGPGRRYVVKSGRAGVCRNNRGSSAEYAFNTAEEPLLNQRVDVEAGATFDLQGQFDVNASVTIAGTGCDGKGALVNTGTAIADSKSQIVQLTLSDDASVGGTTDFGILSPGYNEALVELGAHTLTIDTGARFFLSNVTLSGNGGFNVVRGTLNFFRAFSLASGASMDVSVGGNGKLFNETPLTVRNLDNSGVVNNNGQMITVTGSVTGRGVGHAIPKLTLADGATIKISSADEPLVVSHTLNVNAAATYTFDLAGFDLTEDTAALLVPPSGANLDGVKYCGVNLPGGTCISVRNGVPLLARGGFVFFIR